MTEWLVSLGGGGGSSMAAKMEGSLGGRNSGPSALVSTYGSVVPC